MTWRPSRAALVAVVLAALMATIGAAPAVAQGLVAERRARVEVGLNATVTSPMSLGTSTASLTQPNGNPLTLFRTENRIRAGRGAEVNVGVRLGERLHVEGTAGWVRAELESKISGDADGGADAMATETLARFSGEASLLWTFAIRGDAAFFARGGAGWMRELAGDGTYSAPGTIGTAGLGVKYWLGRAGASGRGVGLRVEGRAVIRAKGLALSSSRTALAPAVAGGIIFGF
jgi:hypothetical protein